MPNNKLIKCWPLKVIGAPDIIPLNFKKAIIAKDSKKLLEIFEKSKEFRKSIIKAGQDTDKPDFGRKN